MKPSRPSKRQLTLLIIAVTLLSSYLFSTLYIENELTYARVQNQALQQDLLSTVNRLELEKARTIMASREADVVRRANELLRGSEGKRQEEIAKLQADLAFYRRLGGASGSQAALAVHHLELQTTQSPRVYRIVFTLTQNLRWASVISGRISLGLDGIRNEVADHLDENQLLASSAEPMNFRFKYFQQLERLITLPDGFEPTRLTIQLKANGLRTPVEHSVQWNYLFSRADGDVVFNPNP
jgi:hypothetical protein